MLNRQRYPTDEEIRTGLEDNLCRCGVYDRALRAIKRAAGLSVASVSYEVEERRQGEFQPEPPTSPTDALPHTLTVTPDLDAWVRINTDGTITLLTGKVELGQDIKTSIAMIGADLDSAAGTA